MGEVDIAAIIAAIGAVIASWLSYNQYRHNKLTDLKIKERERDLKNENLRKNENSALVYGELYSLLINLKCNRVFIIQPHPLNANQYLSVVFEVDRKGIATVKSSWKSVKMSEMPKMSSLLAKNDFLKYCKLDQMEDPRARSIFANNGSLCVVIKKLISINPDWVGSLVVDWDDQEIPCDLTEELIKSELSRAALSIQYILPEITL